MRRSLLVPLALTLTAALGLTACNESQPVASSSTAAAKADELTKPTVKLPAATPTTLGITDIKKGTGPEAVNGSTVLVYYVGVRSADGQEFDSNYGSGAPFSVLLGSGGVIAGWDQGLLGVQAGGRRQLDIPNDLAYKNSSQGAVIKPGDALSFVVDVVAVAPSVTEADEPTVAIQPGEPRSDLASEDLVVGTGTEWKAGQHGLAHLLAYRADTGEQLTSTYGAGAQDLVLGELLPGMNEGLAGMKVGGRRKLTIPFAKAYGEQGNERLGLPAKTDLILVVDLVATY